MPDTMEERLAGLRDLVVPVSVVAAPDLWARGSRWQRRRRMVSGTVLVMAIVFGMLLGSWVWSSRPQIVPAGSEGPARIPDRLWNPSPWLGELAPGVVVAVQSAERAHWFGGSTEGVVGISAAGGSYGFIPMPDSAWQGMSLAPDGRRLAYWGTGVPSGEPLNNEGEVPTVTALVVRDLVSGRSSRFPIATKHGLSPESLLWLDGSRLVASYGQRVMNHGMEGATGVTRGVIYTVGSGSLTPWPFGESALDDFSAVSEGQVLVPDEHDFQVLDPKTGSVRRLSIDPRVPGSAEPQTSTVWDRRRGLVAQIGGGKPDRSPNKVRWTRTAGPRVGEWRVVPHSAGTYAVFGWRDDAILAWRSESGYQSDADLVILDPATGVSLTLVRHAHDPERAGGWSWARDLLLTAPSVAGTRPPYPMDPRWPTAGGILVVVAAIGFGWAWRRRVRP